MLEEEEQQRQASMKEDVVMTEESKEPTTIKEDKPKLAGQAAKIAIKQELVKEHDKKLYRPHG
jgi:ubiquitin carboxyl-terminal hydrolase 14